MADQIQDTSRLELSTLLSSELRTSSLLGASLTLFLEFITAYLGETVLLRAQLLFSFFFFVVFSVNCVSGYTLPSQLFWRTPNWTDALCLLESQSVFPLRYVLPF